MLDEIYLLRDALDKDNCHPKHPKVFYLNDKLIAKAGSEVRINLEFGVGQYLFKNNIKVPEMHSIIKSPFTEEWFADLYDDSWFVFMDRLDGKPLSEYRENNICKTIYIL